MNLSGLDWAAIERSLWDFGYAHAGVTVFTPGECASLREMYRDAAHFRSRIQMERFRFGAGDYQYFANPLPGLVDEPRRAIYPHLAPIANHWMEALGLPDRYPGSLDDFLAECQGGPNQTDTAAASL